MEGGGWKESIFVGADVGVEQRVESMGRVAVVGVLIYLGGQDSSIRVPFGVDGAPNIADGGGEVGSERVCGMTRGKSRGRSDGEAR